LQQGAAAQNGVGATGPGRSPGFSSAAGRGRVVVPAPLTLAPGEPRRETRNALGVSPHPHSSFRRGEELPKSSEFQIRFAKEPFSYAFFL